MAPLWSKRRIVFSTWRVWLAFRAKVLKQLQTMMSLSPRWTLVISGNCEAPLPYMRSIIVPSNIVCSKWRLPVARRQIVLANFSEDFCIGNGVGWWASSQWSWRIGRWCGPCRSDGGGFDDEGVQERKNFYIQVSLNVELELDEWIAIKGGRQAAWKVCENDCCKEGHYNRELKDPLE